MVCVAEDSGCDVSGLLGGAVSGEEGVVGFFGGVFFVNCVQRAAADFDAEFHDFFARTVISRAIFTIAAYAGGFGGWGAGFAVESVKRMRSKRILCCFFTK